MNNDILTHLYQEELIGLIGVHFARFVADTSGETDPCVLMTVALLSQASENQHICFDLTSMAGKTIDSVNGKNIALEFPDMEKWRAKLLNCPAIKAPGFEAPMILDDQNRLYLYRYWEYENILVAKLKEKIDGNLLPVDVNQLGDSLNRLFPPLPDGSIGETRMAAIVACIRRLCVITGGPGTGKTTTVAKILALLLEQPGNERLRIALAAPTGKSAIRLGESIREIKSRLDCSDRIKERIPEDAMTLHRLLRPIKDTPYFFHGLHRPLSADVVIVDEASMVDMPLMAKLVQAIPHDARFILIGDKDQLASVEAGSVLGDICGKTDEFRDFEKWGYLKRSMEKGTFDPAGLGAFETDNISDCIVELNIGYRFSENRDIEALGKAVNQGDAELSISILKDRRYENINFKEILSYPLLMKSIETEIITGYRDYLNAKSPREALQKFNKFKILCTVKRGGFGVEGINRATEYLLNKKGLVDPSNEFYIGRPILITKNDYQNELFNGDMGLIWKAPDTSDGSVYAYFQGASNSVKRIHPFQLPAHETAFAMTVHKSQGSEFESVLLLLPEQDTPVLTRELLYTGVTRARKQMTIWGNPHLLGNGIGRTIKRYSGLQHKLWG